jgi:hypothetical protein
VSVASAARLKKMLCQNKGKKGSSKDIELIKKERSRDKCSQKSGGE